LLALGVIAGTGEPPDSGGHSESGVGSQLWPPDFFSSLQNQRISKSNHARQRRYCIRQV